MSKVVVVGSANADLVVMTDTLPEPGETVLGNEVVRALGGKGANQAVAAARLGADVMLVTATGQDEFGAEIRDMLSRERVDLSLAMTSDDTSTGMAFVTVDSTGSNTIVVAPGANGQLGGERVAALGPTLTDTDIVLMQLEIPVDTCLRTAHVARQRGATTILNAAPLPAAIDETVAELLATVDIVVANEHEARGLAGIAGAQSPREWQNLAEELRKTGPSSVVITLGSHGAVVATDGITDHRPAYDVTVVDTTGAGDAFCGAFAAALASGLAIQEAVRRGCAAGGLAATRVGAQVALPTTAELDSLVGLARPDDPAGASIRHDTPAGRLSGTAPVDAGGPAAHPR